MKTFLNQGCRIFLCLILAIAVTFPGDAYAKSCEDCHVDMGSVTTAIIPGGDPCLKGFSVNPLVDEDCSIDYYLWDFGDGAIELSYANISPLHSYSTAGTYTVSVTAVIVDDDGKRCEFTASTTVTVGFGCSSKCDDCAIDPGFIVVNQQSGCRYDFSLQGFSSSCPIWGIAWDFGDGQTGSNQNVSHVFNDTDLKIVCATIIVSQPNGNLCEKEVCTVVWPDDCEGCARCDIDLGSISAIQHPFNPCRYLFSVSPDIPGGCSVDHYVWDFGDGQQITGGTSTGHMYAGGGPYTVTVTAVVIVDGERCEYSQTRNIISSCPPACSTCNLETGAIAADRFERCGYTFSAPDVSSDCGTISYFWDLGDGTTSTSSSVDHTYAGANDGTVPQTVTLTVTVVNNGEVCTRTISTVIWPDCETYCEYCELDLGSMEIMEDPNSNCLFYFTLPGLSSTCPNSGLQNLSFVWDYGDGSTGTGVNASHIYNGPNDGSITYDVCVTATLTINGETCEVTLCKPFTPDCVDPCDECNTIPGNMYLSMVTPCSLRVQIVPSQSQCPLLHYVYDFGDGNTITSTNLLETHLYTANDDYQVCVTEVRTGPNGIECEGIYCQELRLISCGTNKQGSQANSAIEWQVFPTTAKVGGKLNVNLSAELQGNLVQLIDLQGRILESWNLNENQNRIQLPESATAGMYFLRLKGSLATTQRILIYQ